jgi:hypothetical protein
MHDTVLFRCLTWFTTSLHWYLSVSINTIRFISLDYASVFKFVLCRGSDGRSRAVDRNTFDRRSLAQLTMNEFSDRGSGSVRAESIAASRMERALSEVASSVNSFTPRPGSQQSWLLQAQIWLQLGQ